MNDIAPPVVRIGDTATARGRGVFAARDYRAGDLVEASPVVVLETAFEQLPLALQRMVFAWPQCGGLPARQALALGYGSLYNGANPANLRYEREVATGIVRFLAARDIARGEELTINYSAGDGAAASAADEWFVEHGIRPSVEPAR